MSKEIKDALIHLRIPFSVLLLPVFLFALSQSESPGWQEGITIFIVLHLLVYPSSNAFNSYHDNDQGSIGGLESPPPINRFILYFSNAMDVSAVLLSSLLVGWEFGGLVSLYIIASRAYSHRKIRLKRYPILGFLWVIFFQGGFTFIACLFGLGAEVEPNMYLAAIAASLQIGAVYPISQIYQHEEDLADGVRTISYLLGYRGTFIFSALCFALANLCYFFYFGWQSQEFNLLLIIQLPVIIAFSLWFSKVIKNQAQANFKDTMRFNVLAAITFNLFYLLLILIF